MIWKNLYPNEYLDSAYDVDYGALAALGVRGILFDIDNTLVPHGAPATQDAVELFRKIHRLGMATCLVSNNQTPRVKPFADAVESDFLPDAHKPMPGGYRKACQVMRTDPAETVLIGDQIFTDVWGANRTGIRTILVKPIHPKEEIQIVLKRRLEWFVLLAYRLYGQKRVPKIFLPPV